MKRLINEGGDHSPSFDLPLENELLILKLKAEFGAECTTGDENLPPAVVNEFLKSVYEFEHRFREQLPAIKLYEKLGKPFFRKADAIPETQIAHELKMIKQLLNRHQLELDVLGDYPDRQIYRFITEEFIYQEIDDLDMKGYIHHFCYEDFHPNYELEIRQRSVEFLMQWFNRQLGEYSWQLADPFVHPDSREFRKEVILKRIRNVFDAYVLFRECSYLINDIRFEWNEDKQCGKGSVQGTLKYDAQTEAGEIIHYDGPFEFYLSNSGTWWSIFYFVFPGFAW
ncbi:MAG TPA: hypothetical protein VM101_12480 [Flavitalea sp.]|nr:hypothetical protein [Flavitalea sp.]